MPVCKQLEDSKVEILNLIGQGLVLSVAGYHGGSNQLDVTGVVCQNCYSKQGVLCRYHVKTVILNRFLSSFASWIFICKVKFGFILFLSHLNKPQSNYIDNRII